MKTVIDHLTLIWAIGVEITTVLLVLTLALTDEEIKPDEFFGSVFGYMLLSLLWPLGIAFIALVLTLGVICVPLYLVFLLGVWIRGWFVE